MVTQHRRNAAVEHSVPHGDLMPMAGVSSFTGCLEWPREGVGSRRAECQEILAPLL